MTSLLDKLRLPIFKSLPWCVVLHRTERSVMVLWHKFRGKRWRVQSQRALENGYLGECSPDKKRICIPIQGDTLHELDVIVHEALHACFYDMDEECIDEAATDIAKFLWRLGWRNEVK